MALNATVGLVLFLLLPLPLCGATMLQAAADAAGWLCRGCCWCPTSGCMGFVCDTRLLCSSCTPYGDPAAQLLSLLVRGPYMLHVGGPICLLGRQLLLLLPHASVSTKRDGLSCWSLLGPLLAAW